MKTQNNLSFVKILFFLLFSMGQGLLAQSAESPWKLKTDQDNIKVYTRHSDHSAIKEVRIKATFNIDIEVFMRALNDVENYDKWVYKGINPEHIETVSDDEFYYYIQSDLPFPLSDRDLVVHSKQWHDAHTNTYFTQSVTASDKRGEEEDIVRIELYESSWKIHQKENGTLDIDYKVIADPGGNLPAWVVNMAISQGPLKTMKNLEAFAIERSQLAENERNK